MSADTITKHDFFAGMAMAGLLAATGADELHRIKMILANAEPGQCTSEMQYQLDTLAAQYLAFADAVLRVSKRKAVDNG